MLTGVGVIFDEPISSYKHKFFITSEGSDGRFAPSEDCLQQNLCFDEPLLFIISNGLKRGFLGLLSLFDAI
jgi:hypothetical protein